MSRINAPELTKYLDHQLQFTLNNNRHIIGTLRGFDAFMNVVLEDALHIINEKSRKNIGTVVVRGNSILMIESVARIYK